MAYFNHAFRKTMVATNGISPLNGVQLGTSTANMLTAGQITWINPDTFTVRPDINVPAPGDESCCEVIIAAGSLMANDKIGPFHGGYLESNKTKTIKAKYASRMYAVPANPAQNYVLHVGLTPWNLLNPPSSSEPGETAGTCCKQFLCGETYYLRLDVKGSPVLRTLNHNGYETLEAYTGCCPDQDIAPTPVDPRVVMIAWAKQIRENVLLNQFVYPIVTFTTNNGATWTYYYPDDTAVLPAPPAGVTNRRYSEFGTPADPNNGYQAGDCAGLVLNGAYVETKFGNCTFQVSDFYELEPVRIYASEVDYTGSPCEFQTLCVGVQCYGRQQNGIGETVVRDVILSESYRQNHLATDFRIREITQGYDLYQAAGLSRTALYDRIFIQHNVPRMYNPTGTFDNDQYLIEIITPANPALNGTLGAIGAAIFNQLNAWLISCESRCIVDNIPLGVACAASIPAVPLPTVTSPAI
jgi:hypothetical protein